MAAAMRYDFQRMYTVKAIPLCLQFSSDFGDTHRAPYKHGDAAKMNLGHQLCSKRSTLGSRRCLSGIRTIMGDFATGAVVAKLKESLSSRCSQVGEGRVRSS